MRKRLHRNDRFADIESAKWQAKRALPSSLYDRLNLGAGRGYSLEMNQRAFDELTWRVRVCRASTVRRMEVSVLGLRLDTPVLLAPTGSLRLINPQGAIAAARAARAAGTVCAVSVSCGHGIREVISATDGPVWQQIYLNFGRDYALRAIEAAKVAGAQALVVTVDVPIGSRRPSLKIDARAVLQYAPDVIRHPRWFAGFALDGMNLSSMQPLPGEGASDLQPISWDDFGWIREAWHGPLVIKGVMCAEDALMAKQVGADAIIVSNHGGMLMDGTPPPLSVLPAIAAACGDSIEVLMDGGIRTGSDVVKAIALGARAVLIGRSYIWGLAVGGEAGVSLCLDILREEIDHTLANIGCSGIEDLDHEALNVPDRWLGS